VSEVRHDMRFFPFCLWCI